MGQRVCKLVSSDIARPSSLKSSNTLISGINNIHTVAGRKHHHHQQHCLFKGHFRSDKRQFYTTAKTMSVHVKARCKIYPRTTDVVRCEVPDDKVPWDVDFPEYAPVDFTSATVLKQPPWADPVDPRRLPFNCIDKSTGQAVDRNSFETKNIQVVDGYPRNPRGRTGLKSRGSLGHWGPNHAADPIVTRWKRDEKKKIVTAADGKPILQFVAVMRRDCGEWALPGGMVDPGENRTVTLMREFGEEAMNSLEATDEEKLRIKSCIEDFFKDGYDVYKGYVDDPRNTDNCWMETKAINFHDETGDGLGTFQLNAGDDAADVQWMDIDSNIKLYASHVDFIKSTVDYRNAHW